MFFKGTKIPGTLQGSVVLVQSLSMSRNTNNKYFRYNSSQRRLVTGREQIVEAIVGQHGYSEATLSCVAAVKGSSVSCVHCII